MVFSLYKQESQTVKIKGKRPHGDITWWLHCRAELDKLSLILPASHKLHYISLLGFQTSLS